MGRGLFLARHARAFDEYWIHRQRFGAGSPVDAGETDGTTKYIGGYSYESLGVLGPESNGTVDGKTATPECVQNLDALVAQKAFVFKQV